MRRGFLIAMAVMLTGCAGPLTRGAVGLLGPDLKGAATVLKASEPLLPAGDPWLVCVTSLDALGEHLVAGPGVEVPQCAGRPCLVTEAARLHVLDTLSRYIPAPIKAACGQMLMELLMRAGARLPGL